MPVPTRAASSTHRGIGRGKAVTSPLRIPRGAPADRPLVLAGNAIRRKRPRGFRGAPLSADAPESTAPRPPNAPLSVRQFPHPQIARRLSLRPPPAQRGQAIITTAFIIQFWI